MSRAEGTFTGDSAVVNEVMHKHAPGFVALGFELTGADLAGFPKLQRFPVFHFLNRQTGMQIDVSYYVNITGLNRGFTVLIIEPLNNKLDVEDYLELHGHEELTKSFSYHGPITDPRSFADCFLQNLVGLLDSDLKPILEGRVWEETPIDWMGYK